MKKKILSIILAVVMIVGMIPLGCFTAFAEDTLTKYFAIDVKAGAFNDEGKAESDEGAYINTGIIPTSNTRVVMKAEVEKTRYGATLFGMAYYVDGNYSFHVNTSDRHYGSGFGLRMSWSNAEIQDRPQTIQLDNNLLTIDGEEVTYPDPDPNDSYYPRNIKETSFEFNHTNSGGLPLYLFANNFFGNGIMSYNGQHIRFYSCQIFENGTLVRDFVPAMQGEKFGVYDEVAGEFYEMLYTANYNGTVSALARETVAQKDPTCAEAGYKQHYKFDEKFYQDEDCTKLIENIDSWKTTSEENGGGMISAPGHNWTEAEQNNAGKSTFKTAATCGSDEVYYKVCSDCDAISDTQIWTKSGTATGEHQWTLYDDTKHKCSVCNKTENHNFESSNCVCGMKDPTPPHIHKGGNNEDITFDPIYNLDELKELFANGGNGYLKKDISLDPNLVDVPLMVRGNVNLCLNDKVIDLGANYKNIYVENGAVFSLFDCGETVRYWDVDEYGRWILSDTETERTTVGGCITNGESHNGYGGGGVCVDNGTFNMYGGNIVGNNYGVAYGGGVGVGDSGIFNMYDGCICGNTGVGYGYGGYYYYYHDGGGVHVRNIFNMYGGSICYNKGSNGGAVYVFSGSFNMYDGSICHNIGNAIGNESPDWHGNSGIVYVNSGSFNMYGGNICDNTGGDAGVCSHAVVTVGGTAVIKNNKTTDGVENNLCVENGKTLNIATGDNKPAGGMQVGITTETAPTADAPVIITGTADMDALKYIFADKECQYVRYNRGENKFELALKEDGDLAVTLAECENGCIFSDSPYAKAGDTVYITAVADEGFVVRNVKFNGVRATNIEGNLYTFTMPEEAVTVTAVFDVPHDHIFAEEWTYDEICHWHECICEDEDCKDFISGFGEHTFGEGVNDGVVVTYTCTECGYQKTVLSCDVNRDGKVEAYDLIVLRKALLTDTAYSEVLDCNGDGEFNLLDLIRLKKALANATAPIDKPVSTQQSEQPATEVANIPEKKEIA